MKVKIYLSENDHHGIVLDGNLVEFFTGTNETKITLVGGENYKKYVNLFQSVEEDGNIKECIGVTKSRLIRGNDGTEWIGFSNDMGYRVHIFEEKE
ncbi:MAG: hypothetical protein J6I84_02770 [Bacilli bacterium]|nr:hypothetical protein [Bacilli bacterium]